MVKFKILSSNAVTPFYATEGAAGFDFSATETIVVAPLVTVKVSTGLAFEIPDNVEMNIRGRSGLTLKSPLRVWEGTIDSDYRGEVSIIVQNLGIEPYTINKGERIAQGVLTPVLRMAFEQVEELTDTKRGSGGFGHTGK
jgi:dUTP pyrophosphatase